MSYIARRTIVCAAMTLALCGLGAQRAVATPRHACDLVPQGEVARIVGNATADVVRNPAREAGGARISSCAYYQASGAGNNGVITVTTCESTAVAQARMQSYGEALLKAGGTAEPDTVGGLPALFTVSKGGTVQMYVVQGDVLLGAGVGTRRNGKAIPLRDRSRELATAALGGL